MLYAKIKSDEHESYLKVKKVIAHKMTQYQEVLIADIDGFGKTLIMDNELQTSYIDYQAYHEGLIHTYKPEPNEHMLILGAGEGISTDIALRRGWKHITAIDIDHQAIELIDKHLSDWNYNIYKRQDEFTFICDDALKVLKSMPDKDVSYIVFDLTSQAIIQNVNEWISQIHRVLLPNGLLSWQDGSISKPSYLDKIVREYFQTEPSYFRVGDWRFGHIAKKV